MYVVKVTRPRWPKGAWMKLLSADVLKELIIKKGISYKDLAMSAGVSKGFISHLTGKRKSTMRPIVAYRIAERLDVPVSMLFEVHVPTSASQTAGKKVAA